MNSPAINVTGLRVDRGGRTVLEDLTFTIPRGAVTGLLGPSGCGKTTLIRSIVGVQRVHSGTVEVLVLDEPTVGLDPVLRVELWGRFHDLARAGTTLLVSSHVMDEADRCDRLLLMREGAIVADGTPADLRERTGADDLEEAFVRVVEAVPA